MDLTGLLNGIVELARKAEAPKAFSPESEPGHVYFIRRADGELERREADPSDITASANDLDTVVRFLKDCGSQNAQIWYSREAVTGYRDISTRREYVSLTLNQSDQLNRLASLEAAVSKLKQKPMLDMLRIDLAGTLSREPDLIMRIREVKWKTTESGESASGQGRASIGKRIEAEVSNLADMKDKVFFDVPVFEGFHWRAEVPCAFDVNPEDQTFTIRPLAGAIEHAIREGEEQIQVALLGLLQAVDLKAPIYYGQMD